MEKAKGIDVRFKGHKDIEGYALSILYLTNLKSSVKESVVEITTFTDTDHIAVTFYKDFFDNNKDMLEWRIGEITHTSELIMFGVEYEDINSKIIGEAEDQTDKWLDDETEQEPEAFIHLIK